MQAAQFGGDLLGPRGVQVQKDPLSPLQRLDSAITLVRSAENPAENTESGCFAQRRTNASAEPNSLTSILFSLQQIARLALDLGQQRAHLADASDHEVPGVLPERGFSESPRLVSSFAGETQ